jgi:hypothetical protein
MAQEPNFCVFSVTKYKLKIIHYLYRVSAGTTNNGTKNVGKSSIKKP